MPAFPVVVPVGADTVIDETRADELRLIHAARAGIAAPSAPFMPFTDVWYTALSWRASHGPTWRI